MLQWVQGKPFQVIRTRRVTESTGRCEFIETFEDFKAYMAGDIVYCTADQDHWMNDVEDIGLLSPSTAPMEGPLPAKVAGPLLSSGRARRVVPHIYGDMLDDWLRHFNMLLSY